MESPRWLERALCKNKLMDFWYPPYETDTPSLYYDVARQVCERCPVWDECLESGQDEDFGMWGGLTEKERRFVPSGKGQEGAHGTVVRYRQGCACGECEDAAYRQRSHIDLSIIPDVGETVEDIDTLRAEVFTLLGESLD